MNGAARSPVVALRTSMGAFGAVAALVAAAAAIALAAALARHGWRVLDPGFLFGSSSRAPGRTGIGPALAGTLWLTLTAAAASAPVGIGAAVYLEEYAPRGGPASRLGSALTHLAGVPPVVYGLAGLALFARGLGLGHTIAAGGLTLAAAALPLVVVGARGALRGVPPDMRCAAYAVGATRWQVLRGQVLPAAAPRIASSCGGAYARAAGSAAPLVVLGAVPFATFAPSGPADPLVSLPTQVFAWSAHPQPGFLGAAGSASLALLLAAAAVALGARALARARMPRPRRSS